MDLIVDYINKTYLVAHQIDTMNHFYTKTVRTIVVGSEISSQYVSAKFTDIKWLKPEMDPRECIVSCKTYCATLMVKIDTFKNYIPLCTIPVMVYSDLCIKQRELGDSGGYFIVKGKERVLISYMRSLHDKIYVTQLVKAKYLYSAEIRNTSDLNTSILTMVKCTDRSLVFSIPYIKIFIKGGFLLRLFNAHPETVPFLKETVFYTETLTEYDSVTKDDAVSIVANESGLTIDYIENILSQHLVSKICGENYTITQFGLLSRKLDMHISGRLPQASKEELCNKRVDSPGMLMEYLFNGLYKIFIKSISYSIKSPNVDLAQMIACKQAITNEILTCLLTGNWGIKKKFGASFTRMGMSQVLTANNHPARLAHMRKVMHNIGTKGKNYGVRQLHGSHMGMFCPFETPEGERVGLVLNLAITCEISTASDPMPVFDLIKSSNLFMNLSSMDHKCDPVLINGTLVGVADSGSKLGDWLCMQRSNGIIDGKITIVWNVRERLLEIFTDEGRLIRPLFDVAKLKSEPDTKLFSKAVESGLIVFRASEEINTTVVALDRNGIEPHHTLVEIHLPATMTDVMAGLIPFANHTQSPRIIYQASMGKQAMGMPCLSIEDRYDTTLHILNYPQKHLTKTCLSKPLHAQQFPTGMTPIVAICTMGGFNQEDSILLNKASIERGLFHSTTYKTITIEFTKKTKTETVCVPEDGIKRREFNYMYLNSDGIISQEFARGKFLRKGVVILGKKVIKEDGSYECKSIVLKSYEQGVMDKVKIVHDPKSANVIVHVRLRMQKIPEIGDKFASFTAQKGICGMIVPQEDMPFDKDGIVPDLIINPHAFPSRMTINYLFQMCCELFSCSQLKNPDNYEEPQDASMFNSIPIEDRLAIFLKKMDVESFDSILHSGYTGKKYPTKIFMAPCPYQRLKHLVSEKMYSRVTGPLELLTRQPVAGRRRYGGLKTGEMERDCNISHGASMVLREAMFDKSDKYTVAVCQDCEFGLMESSVKYCQNCGNTNTKIVNIPYTTKLLFQELQAVGIKLDIA